MREGLEWTVLFDLRYRDNNEALREIAKLLRDGHTEPTFLRLLAEHIDPDSKSRTGIKLIPKRVNKSGPPPKPFDAELEIFLEAHIDFFGAKVEHVFAEAEARYGVSRATSARALRDCRKRREHDPELREMHRQTAFTLRDAGDPVYQPL